MSKQGPLIPRSLVVLSISLALCLVAARIVQRRQEWWEGTLASRTERLLAPTDPSSNRERDQSRTWNQVPSVAKRYMHRVLCKDADFLTAKGKDAFTSAPFRSEHALPSSVSLVQTGEFLLQDDDWFPYHATEVISSHGFVWVSRMSALELAAANSHNSVHFAYQTSQSLLARWMKHYIEPFLTLWIVDAFQLNKTSFALISWMKGVKSIVDSTPPDAEFAAQLEVGEAVRWLAELVMLPSMYLPDSSRVAWKPYPDDENKAVLVLNEPDDSVLANVRLTATFDASTGLLTRVEGDRPFLERETKTFRVRTWVATFDNYQWNDGGGLWHPTTMEAAWMSDEPVPVLSIAARANQTEVQYR
jgi:hypothetical protein